MKTRPSHLLAGACLLSACASAPGIDRPMQLDEAYAAREASASEPHDRCGPEFIQERLPGPVLSAIGPLLDGPFRPVCERHDACYRLRERTQAWCDQRMRTEMMDICAAGRADTSPGSALCRLRAHVYFASVDNPFGAYAYEGEAGGRIEALAFSETSPGRMRVCVTAGNTTKLMQQYVVEVYDAGSRRLAREPRFHARNVRAGAAAVICASIRKTQAARAAEVRLVSDRPDTLSTRNDMIVVDRRAFDVAAPERD